MRKQIIILLLLLMPAVQLFAQQEKSIIKNGNELYNQKKYKEAEAQYRKALAKKPVVEGNFNLGDALYRQKQFDKANEQFNKLGESKNKAVAAQAYHNLGNSFMDNKKLEESISAYEKSLLNNPKDEQTRYNLAYAQEKLKKQKQQDKNNKNKDDKNKKNGNDKKNQNKDQNKDKKDQDKNKNDQNKQNQQQQKQQQQQPKMSKEQAQQMLDASNNNEKQTQEKLKNQKLKGAKAKVTRDW